ncbi:RND transporter [Thetidibacter halocola]|uniref:RND transporter n=1 Tax=Thetidibacter halocola TaxID=2827239 RepID=A0A8J7WHA9_9RHOB|nr:RND transporter [Thetidibacter halocola]MBS0125321.1 RND transporter [Thetidibacter halocola]
MSGLRRVLSAFSLPLLVVLCATLGLAPFTPEPHVWEKLKMLAAGDLIRPIDIFDLLMHGAPWLLLAAKLALGPRTPH